MSETTIYNKIGHKYNMTRKADPYIVDRLYSLLNPQKGKLYLDIGCGTGNYTVAFAEMGFEFIGVDPSELMLDAAKNKNSNVKWEQGTAENIPLPDHSIDGVIATLTLHHWASLQKGFKELARVLKAGSPIVIFTFTPEQEKGYWFNHFFPEMMKKGMRKSISFDTIKEVASYSGLEVVDTEKYFVQDDLQDMFGYSGKDDPERYFDPAVINGISYFSLYADKKELEEGLRELRKSIHNGQFNAIKKQYENDRGDYLFVVLKKNQHPVN